MIGRLSEAREILPYLQGTSRRKPPGWKCLRSRRSCSRRVYLSPRGVVYKVDDEGGFFQQAQEIGAWKQRKSLPRGWRMPETRLIDVDGVEVIAQRFVEGVHLDGHVIDFDPEAEYAFERIGLGDSHSLNWMVDARGIKWIVDGGL